ncbi:hypothetical protein BJP25_12090 [Actinokineospora bangkokensis]|uniref:Sigma 54 modulation/S30EA ribosomal protein C-terminal domain-containing protein n=1 Tax=Actinokineospora bangkokensis TaxID=1193682 RepID=A0A1Q9LR64_9PSEU|nr:hypothetical protein BJP25_12090 [Actinokineospora bangkokensis]
MRGVHGEGIADYATERVTSTLAQHGLTAHRVHIAICLHPDPAVAEPAEASADLGVDGLARGVRVKATARTPREAVDLLRHRLLRRLATAQRTQDHGRTRRSARGEQHGARHRVVAHSRYAADPVSVAEAIAHLDESGADNLVFTHTSGIDCLLHDAGDGYDLSALDGVPPQAPAGSPVRPLHLPAPRLTETQGRLRLELSGAEALFYVDPADRRGHLLVRRPDGDFDDYAPDR